MLQLDLLGPELLQPLGVDQGLRRRAGEDAQRDLVVRPEPVLAEARGHHDAADLALVGHRHDEHRFRTGGLADDQAAGVGVGIAQEQRLAVLGHPAGESLAHLDPQQLGLGIGAAHERALECDRLAPAGVVVDAIDADRVVRDQRAGLADDRLADAAHVLDARQACRQVLDRPEPGGEILDGSHEPGVADGGRDRVAEAARQCLLVGRPVVRRLVVEDEQGERRAPEHRGHEAQRGDVMLGIDLAHLRRDLAIGRVAEHEDLPAPERLEPGEVRVAGRGHDPLGDGIGEVAPSDELQRVLPGRVPQPQPGAVGVEEPLRVLEDLLEHGLQRLGAR